MDLDYCNHFRIRKLSYQFYFMVIILLESLNSKILKAMFILDFHGGGGVSLKETI